MTRRQLALLAALAAAGFVLSLFQAWLVNLPVKEATDVSWCRFTGRVDCYESLWRYGKSILIGPLPVFATLLALYFWMAALAGFAFVVRPARAEGFATLAGLAAFPATGLALFVLLHDYRVPRPPVTSASAVVSAGLGLTLSILAVLRGLRTAGLRPAASGAAALLAVAALFAYFVHDAGAARLDAADLVLQRETKWAPRHILHAGAPRDLPRAGAARLGNDAAPREALVFLSDDQAGRDLASALARSAPAFGERYVVYLYAPGDFGAALLEAERTGTLRALLGVPDQGDETKPAEAGDGDAFDPAPLLAWQIEKTPELPSLPATMIAGKAVATPTAEDVLRLLR